MQSAPTYSRCPAWKPPLRKKVISQSNPPIAAVVAACHELVCDNPMQLIAILNRQMSSQAGAGLGRVWPAESLFIEMPTSRRVTCEMNAIAGSSSIWKQHLIVIIQITYVV